MSLRRGLVIAAGVPVLAAAVLMVEIELARRGPDLDQEPFDLDGRIGPPEGRAETVVWLGDSTAAGVGASAPEHTVARRVAAASAAGTPVEMRVLAVSGARIGDVVEEQLPQVAALDADRIYVSVGANDAVHATRVRTFRGLYDELLGGLPEDVEVVILGVPDMGAPPRLAQPLRFFAGLNGERMDDEVRAAAEEHGHTYVDIAAETGPPFRRDPDRYFAADRYHPSDAGYALWVSAVLAATS